MNTSNENNEPVLSEISKAFKSHKHKLSVLERKSIRRLLLLKNLFQSQKSKTKKNRVAQRV